MLVLFSKAAEDYDTVSERKSLASISPLSAILHRTPLLSPSLWSLSLSLAHSHSLSHSLSHSRPPNSSSPSLCLSSLYTLPLSRSFFLFILLCCTTAAVSLMLHSLLY